MLRLVSLLLVLWPLLAGAQGFTPRRPFVYTLQSGNTFPYNIDLFYWYKFDEGTGTNTYNTLNTNVGYGYGLLDGQANWQTGKIGPFSAQSISNPVVFSYIELDGGDFAPTNGTVAWWLYQTNTFNSGKIRFLWSKENVPNGSLDVQVFSDNNWYAGWSIGGNDDRVSFAANAANFQQSNWVHYVLTWTLTNTLFYTNGALCATRTAAVAVHPTFNRFRLGNQPAGNNYYTAIFDDFRAYTNALSSNSVWTLYHVEYGQP